jgi:hypothetical protein
MYSSYKFFRGLYLVDLEIYTPVILDFLVLSEVTSEPV